MAHYPTSSSPLFASTLEEYGNVISRPAVAWLPDGRLCTITMDPQSIMRVQEVLSGKEVQGFDEHQRQVSHASPPSIALAHAGWRWLWNILSGKKTRRTEERQQLASRVSPATSDLWKQIWMGISGKEAPSSWPSFDDDTQRVLSPDGRFLAIGTSAPIGHSEDVTLSVWETATDKRIFGPSSESGEWVINLTWSPDSRLLAYSTDGRSLCVREIPSGTLLTNIHVENAGTTSIIRWSPNGRFIAFTGILAYGHGCSKIYIWDVVTKEIHCVYRGHETREEQAWMRLDEWKKTQEEKMPTTHSFLGETSSGITEIQWSPDGTQIASVCHFWQRVPEMYEVKDIHVWQVRGEEEDIPPIDANIDYI